MSAETIRQYAASNKSRCFLGLQGLNPPARPAHLYGMATKYILRGLDRAGHQYFYTGKAGDAWVSALPGDAFPYSDLQQARNRATRFNSRESLHGLWFVAVDSRNFKA